MYSSGRTKWMCRQCFKHLSSKRSYDEHMNIHNETRPFACDQCEYSAASQMTLRRHKLRNHIPRNAWGYQCPYCGEAYMEPASYQQHVLTRHFGRSATFGCPHSGCTFTTKSSKHFRNHLKKHIFVMSVRASSKCFSLQPKYDISKHLVDDELGNGYGKPASIPVTHRVSALPLMASTTAAGGNSHSRLDTAVYSALRDVDSTYFEQDYYKTPMNLGHRTPLMSRSMSPLPNYCDNADQHVNDPMLRHGNVRTFSKNAIIENKGIYSSPSTTTTTTNNNEDGGDVEYADERLVDWIEAEVIIDDQVIRLSDGQIDDIELD